MVHRSTTNSAAPRRFIWLLMVILATAGLGLSGYLTFLSLATDTQPLGCGAGSGCAEVLASKWSRWLGIPVSALATVLYVVTVWALFSFRTRLLSGRRANWLLLTLLATTLLGAAVWFTSLQLFVVDRTCPYCMADHACGVALAALIYRHALRAGKIPTVFGGLLGTAAIVAVAVLQYNTPAELHRLTALPTDRDFDLGRGDDRRLGVLGGKLHLAPHSEAVIGSPEAKLFIVMMYDYCCPHCRHTHGLLNAFRREAGDDLAVLALPLPMNRQCNEYAPEEMPARFDHSCEVASLALAVHLAAPARFVEFDRWLFEPESPRALDEVRVEAERLVGKELLETTLADPRIQKKIQRTVAAYKQSGADRVPVVFSVGAEPMVGRVEDEAVFREIVEKSTAHLSASD